MKQLYYFNTFDGSGDNMADKVEEQQLEQSVIQEEDCESCVI